MELVLQNKRKPRKIVNKVGFTTEFLTVKKLSDKRSKSGKILWECECKVCGNNCFYLDSSRLSKSKGCCWHTYGQFTIGPNTPEKQAQRDAERAEKQAANDPAVETNVWLKRAWV